MGTYARKAAVLAVAFVWIVLAPQGAPAEDAPKGKPDATVKLTGGTVAIGIGWTWGSGVLTFKGKDYKFKLDGLTTTALGGGSIDASGEVYHLSRPEDFAGSFTGVTSAAAVGGGVGYSNFQNGNGVYLELHSTSAGMLFKAGPSGITVKME